MTVSDGAFQRLSLLLGDEACERLSHATVFLCGVGGVGSWCAEALVRSGIGHLVMMDDDTVKPSNLNRQLCALHSALGRPKVEVLAERLRDIAPDATIEALCEHLTPESCPEIIQKERFTCVIDAIDERKPKLALLAHCVREGIPVVSSMGAGNKQEPSLIQCADLGESHGCRLARLIRKQLRKEGIEKGIRVIFSPEERPDGASFGEAEEEGARRPVGTICHMTGIFGFTCASEAIRLILKPDSVKVNSLDAKEPTSQNPVK